MVLFDRDAHGFHQNRTSRLLDRGDASVTGRLYAHKTNEK